MDSSNRPRWCDFQNCTALGPYRAPKDYTIKEYYWFCLTHVRAYNAAWNFNGHLTPMEIEQCHRNDCIGQRPTWKQEAFVSGELYKQFGVSFPKPAGRGSVKTLNFSTSEQRALEFFRMTELLKDQTLSQIKIILKQRYYAFVKTYHPDYYKGKEKIGEYLRQGISYYRMLKKKLEQLTP